MMNQVVNTKGPVMADTFQVFIKRDTAIMMTVEKKAPAATSTHMTRVGSKKEGRAQPTRMPL